MKTFNSWCAANVRIIGLVLALLIIGMTCLFWMEELRYLEFVPFLLCPMSFFFIWSGKTISVVLVRLFKTKLKAIMVIMLLVGLVLHHL